MKQVVIIFSLLASSVAFAGGFADGFERALASDPTYQAALAEYEVNQFGSTKAGRAYWPEASVKVGARTEQTGRSQTVQVSQPLMDLDRLNTLRGATSLELIAEAKLNQRKRELLQRYYQVTSDWITAREGLVLNTAKLNSFQQLVHASKKALEKGTGTITDLQETEIRLSQAQAENLGLKAQLAAAERQYQTLTGEPPPAQQMALGRHKRVIPLPSLTELKEATQTNYALQIARQNQRLADLEVNRKIGAFAPKVSLVASQTSISGGVSSNYFGVAMDFPLQTGSFLDVSAARAGLKKADQDLIAQEQTLNLDVQRLYESIETGRLATDIRQSVIEAAELSVKANERSFEGGVRTRLDVLNSVTQLAQAKQDYVTAILALGNNLLGLHAAIATPIPDVLKLVEKTLF